MIGYVTLGTKDLKKSAAFYDKIAAEMGVRPLHGIRHLCRLGIG